MFLHVNTYIFYVLYTLHTIIIFNINNTVIWLLASVSWFVLHDSGDKGKQIKRQSRIRLCLHQLPDICKSKYERKRKIADISTTKGGMVGAGRFTNKRSYTGIRLGFSRVCVSSCVHRLRLLWFNMSLYSSLCCHALFSSEAVHQASSKLHQSIVHFQLFS